MATEKFKSLVMKLLGTTILGQDSDDCGGNMVKHQVYSPRTGTTAIV